MLRRVICTSRKVDLGSRTYAVRGRPVRLFSDTEKDTVMKQQMIGLSFGFAALVLATEMANAQQRAQCAERNLVIDRLTTKYGETRQTMGLAANNGIVEMHASDETGSWTITVTHPNGITCLVAAGTSFEAIEEELPAALGAPT